jgi:hypothetical protein
MKIKAWPADVGMLESNEELELEGWLAELQNDGHAESPDEGGPGAEDNGHTKSRGDGRAETRDDGRTRRRADSYARSRGDGRAETRGDGRAETEHGGRRGPRHDGHAGSAEGGRARPRDDGQAKPSRDGYRRPEALAAAPVTPPVNRAQTTVRAVIGDELRLPIAWCEMGSCISWFAHPAALGEADIRARAMDAGWRLDAVGVLVCPQCVQTSPRLQSPLPVALWDREEATARPTQVADEPGADVVAGVARELSHDLRCPAGSHRDEAAAASAWLAAGPADDVARSVSRGTSDEVRHPADDHQPESHPRPGRHRKRLGARLMFAGH